MNHLNRITVNPPSMRQQAVHPWDAGARVKEILDLLAAGVSREEILQGYPYLEDDDITAALE